MAYPHTSGVTAEIRGSVFSALAHRLATFDGEVYPLHVGDTWLEPLEGCRMEDLTVGELPGLHRYSEPQGRAELLDRLAARLEQRTGASVATEQVFVTAGATAGLFATLLTLVKPAEEVLILAPHWPLIEGMVRACRATPVPVSVEDDPSTDELVARLDSRLSDRVVALYFSTPNNPTGRVLDRSMVEALVEWGRRHQLWVLADEVYEDYVYRGTHTPALPLAPERTVVAYSFSKAYGMAGNRCGYLTGPSRILDEVRKVGVHSFYSTPTASQIAALRALDRGDAWLRETADQYRRIGDAVAAILGVDSPQGGPFLFIDVSEYLDSRGLFGFLEDCAEKGLFLAPGPSFGPYPNHVRLCFTAVEPAVTRRGARVLRQMLAEKDPCQP